MSEQLDRASAALRQRDSSFVWVGFICLMVAVLWGGLALGAMPLAVDLMAASLVLFAGWQGYRIGAMETLGWAASWVIPLAGAGLAAKPLDAWFAENVPVDIPFRRHVLYFALFFGLLALVRQLFGRVRGPRASGVSAVGGAVLGGGFAVAAVAVGLQAAVVVGGGLEGSRAVSLSQEAELVDARTLKRVGGSFLGVARGISPEQTEVGIFYGRDALTALAGAEEVTLRQLTEKGKRFGKYRTSGPVATLSGGALPVLREALADVDLYVFEVRSPGPIEPGHALEFRSDKGTLVLLLDLSGHRLGWVLGKTRAHCDINPESEGYEALRELVDRAQGR